MKKVLITILFLTTIAAVCHAESMTLSTYYPAPFGSYDRLRLSPRETAPLCDASMEGLMYYDGITKTIYICGVGSVWEPITGVWIHDPVADTVYLTNSDADENGIPAYVGLGSNNPQGQLYITGNGGESGELLLENTGVGESVGVIFADPVDTTRYKLSEWQGHLGLLTYDVATSSWKRRIAILPNGNFGIGTITPESRLEIKDPARPVALHRFGETTGRGEVLFYENATKLGGFGAFGADWDDAAIRMGIGITSSLPEFGSIHFRTTSTDGGTQSMMTVTNDGDIGIGTSEPIARLDIRNGWTTFAYEGATPHGSVHISSAEPYLTFSDTDSACQTNAWRMGASGNNFLVAAEENDCANTTVERFFIEGGTGDAIIGDLPNEDPQTPDAQFHVSETSASDAFRVDDELNDPTPFIIDQNGNVGIGTPTPAGKLDVNGPIYQRGGLLSADYVFEEDYDLKPIKENARFMWANKHLEGIPKLKTDEQGRKIMEVGAMKRGMIEELEKAHIYIEQLETRINGLERAILELSQ